MNDVQLLTCYHCGSWAGIRLINDFRPLWDYHAAVCADCWETGKFLESPFPQCFDKIFCGEKNNGILSRSLEYDINRVIKREEKIKRAKNKIKCLSEEFNKIRLRLEKARLELDDAYYSK